MREYAVTRKEFTKRVTEREDNYYYKYDMVREIINMYNEELAKALMNGEAISIYGIGERNLNGITKADRAARKSEDLLKRALESDEPLKNAELISPR